MPPLAVAFLLILTAFGTGILSGMAVGGGSVLVPALVYLFAVPQHVAQGAVLLYFLPSAVVAAAAHLREGNVRLGRAVWLVAGSVPGALLGASLAAATPAPTLRRIFGVYLLAMGLYTILARPRAEQDGPRGPLD